MPPTRVETTGRPVDGFYVVTSGLMLLWCLRYRHARPRDALIPERRLA